MAIHVLITGGAGFIGSLLADALLARGHRVRALDSLSPQSLDEAGINRRDPAQHPGKAGILTVHGSRRGLDQIGVYPPSRVDLEIPVRNIVGLVQSFTASIIPSLRAT